MFSALNDDTSTLLLLATLATLFKSKEYYLLMIFLVIDIYCNEYYFNIFSPRLELQMY